MERRGWVGGLNRKRVGSVSEAQRSGIRRAEGRDRWLLETSAAGEKTGDLCWDERCVVGCGQGQATRVRCWWISAAVVDGGITWVHLPH